MVRRASRQHLAGFFRKVRLTTKSALVLAVLCSRVPFHCRLCHIGIAGHWSGSVGTTISVTTSPQCSFHGQRCGGAGAAAGCALVVVPGCRLARGATGQAQVCRAAAAPPPPGLVDVGSRKAGLLWGGAGKRHALGPGVQQRLFMVDPGTVAWGWAG